MTCVVNFDGIWLMLCRKFDTFLIYLVYMIGIISGIESWIMWVILSIVGSSLVMTQ